MQVDEGASLLAEGPEQGEVRGEGKARKVDAQQLLVATPVRGTVEERVRVVQHVLRPKGRLQIAGTVRHKVEAPARRAGLHEVGREIGPPPVRRVVCWSGPPWYNSEKGPESAALRVLARDARLLRRGFPRCA